MSSKASLLAGHGTYVGDIDIHGQLWASIVRSDSPSGLIGEVDTSEALRLPDVAAVFSGNEIEGEGVIPSRFRSPIDLSAYYQSPIARREVKYVGEPVAVVVATDPYVAEDARDLVFVDYLSKPPREREAEIPQFAEQWLPGETTYVGCLKAGFGTIVPDEADEVIAAEFKLNRHTGIPMETRGLIADYSVANASLTVWGTTKVPLANRAILAQLLDIEEARIRFINTDVGGGFGVRGEFYPEDFLIPWLSITLHRPVKWIEDRREHLIATNHSRDQVHKAEMGVRKDGTFVWFKDEIVSDMGAYIRTNGPLALDHTLKGLPGPYKWRAYDATGHIVLTHKTPTGVYRAPGYTEATTVREALIDKAAAAIQMDPFDIRAANLVSSSEMPFVVSMGDHLGSVTFDNGSFHSIAREVFGMDHNLPLSNDHDDRKIRTMGCSAYTLETGVGLWESAGIRVDGDGIIHVISGSADVGQGTHDVLAQIAARELGVGTTEIEVHLGDSTLVKRGVGSFGSRTTVMAGSALKQACEGLKAAAEEVATAMEGRDVKFRDGRFVSSDNSHTDPLSSWAELARRAGTEGRLDELKAESRYETDRSTFGFGVAKVWASLDPETGELTCDHLVIAYDVGKAIDRRSVEGQLIGGAVQGLGGALLEEFVYSEEDHPVFAGFMEYLIPTCGNVPSTEALVMEESPADNPLGVRGAGEAGTPGIAAAMLNALHRVVGMPSRVVELPLSPGVVHEMILRAGRPV